LFLRVLYLFKWPLVPDRPLEALWRSPSWAGTLTEAEGVDSLYKLWLSGLLDYAISLAVRMLFAQNEILFGYIFTIGGDVRGTFSWGSFETDGCLKLELTSPSAISRL